jgi:hypothetical protein
MGAPLYLDVLAAARYLRKAGAKSVSIVGGSLGGGAAGDASVHAEPGEIDRIVFLGASADGPRRSMVESSTSSRATTPMRMDPASRRFAPSTKRLLARKN